MTTPTNTDAGRTDAMEIRKTVDVPLGRDAAFELFTTRMTEFWPSDYTIGSAPFVEIVIEPTPGGRWFERAADGSECPWGVVAEWDPPGRLVLEWKVGASWAYDPELHTFVEVTFSALGDDTTRVELRHHGLESYGDRAEEMREVYGSPDGWTQTLRNFDQLARGRD